MSRVPALLLVMILAAESQGLAQKATAVATGRADLNGDGRPDELRIDEMGNISALITGQDGASAWTTLQAMGKVVDASFEFSPERDAKGRAIIVVKAVLRSAQGRRREEGVVLAYEPGTFSSLWRGRLGLAGGDGSTTTSLEVSPFGVIKYANRHGVVRCDEETAHLDAERLDVQRGVFRPARQAVRVPSSSTVLRADSAIPEGMSQDARGILFRPQGASSSARAASSAELVAPVEISDGDPTSAWIDNISGVGRGEFVTFKSSVGEVAVKALRLRLGHGAAYLDYDRPKRLGLALSKSERYWIDIAKDPKAEQWVVLPAAVRTGCVTLIIDEVYPGRKHKGQTAISEVNIVSEEELSPAGAAELIAKNISEGRAQGDMERLLKSLGPAAAPALVKSIDASGDERLKLRLRLALARIPAQPEQLVLALLRDELSSEEESLLAQGLRGLQAEGMQALSAALHNPGIALGGYRRLCEQLAGFAGQDATSALMSGLNDPNEAKRSAAGSALGKRHDALQPLLAALTTSPSPELQAGVYRSLGLLASHSEALSAERNAISQALLTEMSEQSSSYESHYRLLQAAGATGGNELAVALLAQGQALIDKGGSDAESLVLLRLCTTLLGQLMPISGEPALSRSVEEFQDAALRHPDPGVRLAAVTASGQQEWAANSLAERLRVESWPEVRRASAASLGALCTPLESARSQALERAARTDDNGEVSLTALAALTSCNAAGLLPVLIELLVDGKRPLELRLHAARSVGLAAKSAGGGELVYKQFRKARRQALADGASGKLASAMTASLAELGGPQAIELLESAASDPAFPELQAAALNALGQLCPSRSLALVRKLGGSQEHNVATAARRALAQCR